MRSTTTRVWSLLLVLALFVTACGSAPSANDTQTTSDATATPAAVTETDTQTTTQTTADADLLADILARGVLRISTDPAYPPQSELVEDATIPADTKCTGEEHVAAEFTGFDIDVAVEIAKRLSVEPCFVTPDWTLITGGNWSGRWDISVGSMTITPERMQALYFSLPYYTTPAAFYVHGDNTSITTLEDLSGKRIGVCSGCTYESYLDGSLEIPGETITFTVTDAEVTGYDTDTSALQDLALGDGVRLDGAMTALPTGQGFIDSGQPIKQLGEPAYFEYLAAAFDRNSSFDSTALRAKVTEIIAGMHSDGTLKALSEQYYGTDLATPGAAFDLAALDQ